MPEIIPYVTADRAGIRDEAELVEKLVSSGAISETERQQLLNQFLAEHQADRESSARRARFAPTADLHIGEDIMNAHDIVTQIAHTRNVMSAQVQKLNELTPTPLSITAAEAGGTGGLSDLLQATIAGHISNAADSLRALALVEATMCTPVCETAVTEPSSASDNPQIIDAKLGG